MSNFETPHGDLVKKFPIGAEVCHFYEPHTQFGVVVSHRAMADRAGLYPVVLFKDGVLRFSGPSWQLRRISTFYERLCFAISDRQPGCSVQKDGSQIYLSTPGANFRWCRHQKKLSPEIPSPRYKSLQAIALEAWKQCEVESGITS